MGRSVIDCSPDNYANFLSSLVFLLVFGFAWGHISQSPKKLLRILNKMYAYIVLPALALVAPISIRRGMPLWSPLNSTAPLNSTDPIPVADNPIIKILLIDLIVKSTLWVAVVLALLITFRDKKILKTAGLAAQFIIHGNDIGFSKSLLEVSCRWVNSTNTTGHYDKVDFMPIEVPTNTMCFLIFLPLTNGLVGMTAQNTPTVRGFLRNVFKQVVKFGFSYICLIIGIVIAITSPGKVEKLSSFEDMIKMLETLLTLMCGVYIYYLVMNCTWGAVSIPKTLALTAAVTVIYPSMHYVIYEYWTKEKHIHDHEFVILGHASTPSSIYIQIYILKHIRCPTNYIAAFLLTNVFGGILMYAFVIVKEMFHTYHKDNISPVDFYVAKDQWEFQLTSALLLAVFAMLIYARLHQTSVLRKIIFIALSVELIADVVSLIGYLAPTDESPICGMILSAFIMVDHIGETALIVLLFVYKYHPFFRTKWKALVTSIFMAAILIPTILYTGTYLYFEKSINDHSLSFNNKSIYFFLDLRRYKNDTSDLNISHPIGVISYTAINAIAICIYVAACCAAHYSRERSTDNEDLVETIEDSEDKEKYTACKVFFSYQFCVIVMGIAFGIRNIKYTKKWQESNSKWIDYSMEFIELSSLILADLAGAAMTLIFCISPGNMENEIKRFLHIPMKIRAYLTRCTDMDSSLDLTNLPLGDLDRCRRFVLYHKTAFTTHYPPTVRDNKDTFEGRSLVAFLVQTGVADSPGEAVNLADSYLRGRLITGEEHTRPFRGGILTFEGDNTKYILVPDDEIPDFSELLQNRAIQERPFFYLD